MAEVEAYDRTTSPLHDDDAAPAESLTGVLSVSDNDRGSADYGAGSAHPRHRHVQVREESPKAADGDGDPRRHSLDRSALYANENISPSHNSDADSVRSSGTACRHFAEGDVCYSPYTRRTVDSAVDHVALNEYLATGEVDVVHRKAPTSSGTAKHITRRDSKGFTFGKPQIADPQRFMFYSKVCGVLRANVFAKLYEEGQLGSIQTLNGKQEKRRLHKSVSDIIKAGNYWLDVTSPTAGEMKAFSKIFGIHPLTVEDIQMQEDREKCEIFPSYYFVCFRTFNQDQYSATYMQPVVYYMVVLQEGVLSFHFSPAPHAHNVLARIEHLRDYISVTADWICYALIDDIADSFGPVIRQLEAEVVSIDELVLILKESEQSDMLQRIGHTRRNVMGLLRLLNAKPDVIKVISKRLIKTSDIALYYGDIQDHLLSMLSNLNYFEGVLGRSHSNYLAQISIEITQSSNQTNTVLNKITVIGTILLPMNVVTGLWGMNVPVPGGLDSGPFLWFYGIITFLMIFSMISLVTLRRYQAL